MFCPIPVFILRKCSGTLGITFTWSEDVSGLRVYRHVSPEFFFNKTYLDEIIVGTQDFCRTYVCCIDVLNIFPQFYIRLHLQNVTKFSANCNGFDMLANKARFVQPNMLKIPNEPGLALLLKLLNNS